MDVLKFEIPEWALCYLINADASGLSDEEIAKVDRFVEHEGIVSVCCPDGDGYFARYNDIENVGGSVYECECIMKEV